MEFVSGYRDEFLDFAALLFGWFRKFVTEKGTMGTNLEGRWRQLEAQIRRLPQDPALWVLHVLPNRSVGISLGQGAEPGPGPGLGASRLLGDEPPLHLRDLSPYVSFVSLEDGEEGEEEEDEQENGKESSGTEKAEPQEGGEPAPPSRELPQEAKPPAESEVTQQEASCEDGCREDRGEDERAPEKRKGRRSEAAPLHLSCLLLVTDEHGTILGIDLLMDGTQGSVGQSPGTENLAPRAYALLCHSMACPMGSGDPRKPRQLTVGDAHLHRDLESLVPRLGVKLAKTPMRTWGPRPGFTFASLRARTCHVCHKHSFEVKLTPCPQCSAVLYCGEACLQADWRRCPDDVSHRFWCPRLATFMERAGELASLPFTYTAGDPYQLLQGDGPALMPPVPLDPPRSLFVPELNIQNKQSLKIHVVEAGKEFDLVMVFWELLVLLPHVALELQFVGDSLPPESDQQHFTMQRDGPEVSVRPGSGVSARLSSGTKEKGGRRDLQIRVSTRPYHLLQGPKPDLVIGFNSGFGLKDTWLSSLPRLQSLRVPAFFTESSEYGCVMDDQTMAVATGGGTSSPQPNPFRSPFRLRAADNCMPWYCNAFIFHLVYKPAQGGPVRSAPGPAPRPPTPAAPPVPARRRRGEKKAARGPRRRR
ncbi:zinc finger MYND domain-containing protein 15 isoform X10 [Cricetulus griseus]|uniref:Zinc finger MYND domain-containing protein 15 isoform X10 n=1 Tax=Cricetulus griseus TaxID=10029 RepID=A0A9J7H6V4_CRIGR|nr:zinc finger MYND domain-containing protein 15 isoform X10 [Cricetulus griseus]